MRWTCVHDHLYGAAAAAAALPGAVRVNGNLTHVPSEVLPPGSILAYNGRGGFRPDDGSVYQFDSRGGGRASDRATCPNGLCREAEAIETEPDCSYDAYEAATPWPRPLNLAAYDPGDPALFHARQEMARLSDDDHFEILSTGRVTPTIWARLVAEFGDDGPELPLEVAGVIVALVRGYIAAVARSL